MTTPNGTVNTTGSELSDAGIEAGGPILRNKLFFFGAVDPQWEKRTFIAPADFPLASLGEVDRKRQVTSYAAKGTWQATQNHRFDASFFGDPAHGDLGPQRTTALLRTTTSGFSELEKYGGHNQSVRYDGIIASHWLVEASFARALNEIVEIPSVDEWNMTDTTVTPNIISGGIGFFEQGNRSENFQYQAKATNLFGNHQLKYGVLVEDVSYDQINNRTGPTFTLVNGEQTATGAIDSSHCRPHVRADLPCDPREPEHRAVHRSALYELLRAGHVAGQFPPDDSAGHPLRAAGSQGHARRLVQVEQQLGAATRRDVGSDRLEPVEGVRQLRHVLLPRAERPRGARAVRPTPASAPTTSTPT